MKRPLITTIAAVLLVGCGHDPDTRTASGDERSPGRKSDAVRVFPSRPELDTFMKQAMQGNDLPSIVAMAIHRSGETISYEHGKAIWGGDVETTPDHLFRIHSIIAM